jgi:hypothetical protein
MLIGPFTSGIAVETAGAGTGVNDKDTPQRLTGRVRAIYVKYCGTVPPATTDVTITTEGTYPAAPSVTLLTLTDKNTSGWFFPRVAPHSVLGVALIALTVYESIPIDDIVNIAIAGADNDNYAECWFMLDRC